MHGKLIDVMARAEYEHAWGKGAHWPPHNQQIHAKFIRRTHAVLAALKSAGYAVVPVGDKTQMQNVVEELQEQLQHSLNAYSLPLWPEEAGMVLRTLSAMIEATKNPPRREPERAEGD